MNKKIVLIIAFVVIVVLGLFLFRNNKTGQNKFLNSDKSDKTVISSIKDALSKDLTLTCEFKDDNSGKIIKSFIKNGAVRITTDDVNSQSGEIIIKSNKMYMWDKKTKTGFVYDIPNEDSDKVGMTGQEINQTENYLNMIDKYKDSCKAGIVEDSYFSEPSDVNFQDMSKMIQDIKNQIPTIPEQ